MTDRTFLELQRGLGVRFDHDVEVCGHCCTRKIFAEVARDMLAAMETAPPRDDDDRHERTRTVDPPVPVAWAEEAARRWRETKFYKLWVAEHEAGRDPHIAFRERGWTP